MDITDKSINPFQNLNDKDWQYFLDLNKKIQNNKSDWAKMRGGNSDKGDVSQFPYVVNNPLIDDFSNFMYEKGLIINFEWTEWKEGHDWFRNTDNSKYKNLDIVIALKLITLVIRKNRFHDGVLGEAFSSDDIPKILNFIAGLGKN